MALEIVQDNHASAVVAVEYHEGVPVLIHAGGRYPSLQAEDGTKIESYIEISLYYDGYHVSGRSGYGYGGRLMSLGVGIVPTMDDARALYPAAAQAIKDSPGLYEQARKLTRKFAPGQGHLSRSDYVALCLEHGFEPLPDDKLSSWGDFSFPEYSLSDLPSRWTNQRRGFSVEREKQAAEEKARSNRLAERDIALQAMRRRPVSRTQTSLMPLGTPDEYVVGGELHTVTKRQRAPAISEDDPSIHGSHLLGHEGEPAETVTVEIR